jgi:hypothetical protein
MNVNLAQQASGPLTIFDIPGCKFTSTSLMIKPGLQFDHWQRLGDLLKKTGQGVQFWIGDWIRYGEAEYGEKYAQAIATTGQNYQTLADDVYVASNVDISLRNENLSFNHHRAVASLPPIQQKRWLKRAVDEAWSYRELRREIERETKGKDFRLTGSMLEKIWERVQDGCYTIEAIMKCSECGKDIFGLDAEEVKLYLQQLMGAGRVDCRKQGGKKDTQRGDMVDLYVPSGTPAGSDFNTGYRPRVEYGEQDDEHF